MTSNTFALLNVPIFSDDASTWNVTVDTAALKQIPSFANRALLHKIAANFAVAGFQVPEPTATTENSSWW
jgi:hypothetical protein